MKRLLLLLTLGFVVLLATSSNPQTPVKCSNCGGSGVVFVGYNYYGQPMYQYCTVCGGKGVVYNVPFRGDKYVYVKGAKCTKGGCHCDGYKGVQTSTGLYKGACQNTDGWGHTCGHSPKDHGLQGSK